MSTRKLFDFKGEEKVFGDLETDDVCLCSVLKPYSILSTFGCEAHTGAVVSADASNSSPRKLHTFKTK